MSRTTRTTLSRAVSVIAGLGAAAALTVPMAHAAPAAPADATTTAGTGVMTSAALLDLEDIGAAGLPVNALTATTTGNQYLGDAGRFDEGCLGEKTLRSITGSKNYPEPGEARAYADATYTSTTDKEVWLSESIAEGRTKALTDSYVAKLTDGIARVKECQQDPGQGHSYSKARTVSDGTATATYYLDLRPDGTATGGGVAVIRDGNRFGYVDLMSASGKPGTTLRAISLAAARELR